MGKKTEATGTLKVLSSNETRSDLTSDEDVRLIAREIAKEEMAKEAKEIRKDFMTIFGLFAGFLTFTVLQIQSLIQQTRMAYIMGASSFFVATTLTFVLGLHSILKEKEPWKNLIRPTGMFILVILIYFFSFQCFWYATQGNIWPSGLLS
jgi:hypothetical protein